MSSSKFETLKNMNTNTGKHAVWCIVIHDPKVIAYTFKARGESVNAERFQCVIGSSDPKQYMMGSIPFSFTDRGAAKKALEKFRDKSVWILRTPAFDTRSKNRVHQLPTEKRTAPSDSVEIDGCPGHQQKRARAPIEVSPSGPQSPRVTRALADHAIRQDRTPRWHDQN